MGTLSHRQVLFLTRMLALARLRTSGRKTRCVECKRPGAGQKDPGPLIQQPSKGGTALVLVCMSGKQHTAKKSKTVAQQDTH